MHEKWIKMLIRMHTKYLYYGCIRKYLLCDCKYVLPYIGRIMHIVICRYWKNCHVYRIMWIAIHSSYMKNYDDEYLDLVMPSKWCMYTSTCLHSWNWYVFYMKIYLVFCMKRFVLCSFGFHCRFCVPTYKLWISPIHTIFPSDV